MKEKKEGKILPFPKSTKEKYREELPELNKEINELSEELRWMREAIEAPIVEVSKKDRKKGKKEPKNLTDKEKGDIRDILAEEELVLGRLLMKRTYMEQEIFSKEERQELIDARKKVA